MFIPQSNSEDEDEFEYEKRSRMGPQGANAVSKMNAIFDSNDELQLTN